MAANGLGRLSAKGVQQSPIQSPAETTSGSGKQTCDADQLCRNGSHMSLLKYRSLAETAPEGIGIVDSDEKLVFVNRACAGMLGYQEEELLGHDLSELVVEDELAAYRRETHRRHQGQPSTYETVLRHKGGEHRCFRISASPLLDDEGRLLGTMHLLTDITAAERREAVLEARCRLATLADTCSCEALLTAFLDEAEVLTDSRIGFFHFVEDDQATISLQAWSTNTLTNMCTAEGSGLHYPIDKAGVWVDCVCERQPVVHNDYASLSHRKGIPEGHAPVVRELVVPVLREGKIVAILGVGNKQSDYVPQDVETVAGLADLAWDIVVRKRAEDALEESERRFRDLYENAPNAYFSVGIDGLVRRCNRRAGELLGYAAEELVGRPAIDLYADTLHGKRKAIQVLERFKAGETVRDEELEMLRADGIPVWISLTVDASRDSEGRAVESRSMVVDITERKRAEHERLAHLHFLESMDQVNRAIQGTSDLEQMMSDVLDAMLSVFSCDRVWLVYPCDPNAAYWKVLMERTTPEYPRANALGVEIPMDPGIRESHRTQLASDGPMKCGPGTGNPLPTEDSERFGYKCSISMAIYPKNGSPWQLGMHQCSHPRVWTPEEERLFEAIGRRLSDGLTSLLSYRDLRESEAKLRDAQRLARLGNWEWDVVHNKLWWSEEVFRVFGIEQEEFDATFEAFISAVHPDDRERVKASIKQALERESQRWQIDYRIVCADGTTRFVHEEAETAFDSEGQPKRRAGTVQDITERKRAEEALRKSEQRFEQVAANAREWIWETDTDGRYTYASSAVREILGYSPEEIVGVMHFYDLFHPEDREEAKQTALRAFAEKQAFREFPNRNVHKDGMEVWLSTSGIPVLDEKGGLLGYRGTDTDITALRRAEQERQAHLRFFECMDHVNRAMLGTDDLDQMMRGVLDVVLSVFDCDRTFLMYPCDPEAATWYVPMERTKPEYPGVLDLGLEMPMDPDVAQTLRLVLASEGPVKVGPGTPHPLPADVADRFSFKSYMSMAVYPKEGKPWQFGIHQCSYARIWTEEEEFLFQEVGRRLTDALSSLLMLRSLRESEERFRGLVTQAADAFFLLDGDGRILDVNQSASDYLGYAREELLEMNIADVDVEVEGRRHKERFWDSLRPAKSATFEGVHRRKDGSTFPVEVRLGTLDLGPRHLMLGLARDITERKLAEEALRSSEERFRAVVDNSPIVVFSIDVNGMFLAQRR